MKLHPVVFVLGPTAVGKSDFALAAAKRFSGVLLNCDSVQSYSRVQVGAAKPDLKTLNEVGHYLWDWVHPPHILTAAEFRRRAILELEHLTQKSPVFAVGGSGFYVRALMKGLYPVRRVPKERTLVWRERLKAEGSVRLHEELQVLDPVYAQRLSPNDGYRIIRALELIENEGKSLTTIQAEFEQKAEEWPYRSLKIGLELPREELRQRIAVRAEQMLQMGLRQEVEDLLRQDLKEWAPLKSIGYKEVVEGLAQNWSDKQIQEAIALNTSQLAKKQMTWFKSDKEIEWFEARPQWQKPLERLQEFFSRQD
ncbi:MAG: tRNA (adenosine(37)-N6)-dimethylallyltransferase MiaA [Bdellovibrionales bacterium]